MDNGKFYIGIDTKLKSLIWKRNGVPFKKE